MTLEKLIKNHSSNFDKTLDLHSLALRVPTFSEGSLASIIEQVWLALLQLQKSASFLLAVGRAMRGVIMWSELALLGDVASHKHAHALLFERCLSLSVFLCHEL